jgi:hypothetical protein
MEPPRKKQKLSVAVFVSAPQQQRERALCHWFYNAKSANPAIREPAQARIQLQLQLRAYRKAIDKWKGKLRDAEREGNRSGFEKFGARRVENVKQLHIWTTVLRTSFLLKDDKRKRQRCYSRCGTRIHVFHWTSCRNMRNGTSPKTFHTSPHFISVTPLGPSNTVNLSQ